MEGMGRLKSSKVFITGGAGFIGSHLIESLARDGHNVVCVDFKVDPKSYFIISGAYKKCEFQILNICDRDAVRSAIEFAKPEFIIHLAAQTLVTEAYNNPYETFNSNIMGTVNILEAVRQNTLVKGVIIASSDKAYGKSSLAYTESNSLSGDHPYDVSKSSTDLIATTYFKTYQLPVVVTRFGNVYGEGDCHFDRIVPGICESIIKNKTFEVRSNGEYVRDYLYVKDVVDGYKLLLSNMNKVVGNAYNFSSKDKLSVIELIKKVEIITGRKIDYKILNNAKNEIPYQHLRDLKVRKLGWYNNYNLEMVFPDILNWYRNVL